MDNVTINMNTDLPNINQQEPVEQQEPFEQESIEQKEAEKEVVEQQEPPQQDLSKEEPPKNYLFDEDEKHITFLEAYEIVHRLTYHNIPIKSTALDILAIYLKAQKILYTEAKTYCEQKLNLLMLPAILISSLCVVVGIAVDNNSTWGRVFVGSLNSLNVFLLSIVSYLKLDAKAEAHKTSAYKYDKLQAHCEFLSGRVIFFSDIDKAIIQDNIDNKEISTEKKEEIIKMELSKLQKTRIDDIETKVTEIKETNQFILPEYIRYNYPQLFSRNVFAEVKKIQTEELFLINQFKEIINKKINFKNMYKHSFNKKIIYEQMDKKLINDEINKEIKQLSQKIQQVQDKIIYMDLLVNEKLNNLIMHKNKFLEIDKKFNEEIEKVIKKKRETCCRTNFFNT